MTHPSAVAEGRRVLADVIADRKREIAALSNSNHKLRRYDAMMGIESAEVRVQPMQHEVDMLSALLSDHDATTQQLAALGEAVEKLPRLDMTFEDGICCVEPRPEGRMIDRAAVLSLFDRSPETKNG